MCSEFHRWAPKDLSNEAFGGAELAWDEQELRKQQQAAEAEAKVERLVKNHDAGCRSSTETMIRQDARIVALEAALRVRAFCDECEDCGQDLGQYGFGEHKPHCPHFATEGALANG